MDASLVLPGAHDLDALEDPAAGIILSCERAKAWLAEALAGDHIEQIVELKAQAEAIRHYSIAKQLGHDAELSAAEVVRRAERGIGLAIKKGQAAGCISKSGQHPANNDSRKTVESFGITRTTLAVGPYVMADAPDEAFEAAIKEGKAARNLSRRSVVRKLKNQAGPDRWAKLADLAADGHSSSQIAKELGVGREQVRRQAKSRGIEIHADRIVGRTKRIDSNRILREFVATLESLVPSCDMIDIESVKPDVLTDCLAALDDALREINKLRKRLKRGPADG